MAAVLKSAVQARNSRSTERGGGSRGSTDRAKAASSAEKYKLGGTMIPSKHITERIEEEEDKNTVENDDLGSGGEDEKRRNMMKPKKNFLRKNILD
jgi:hypothetical protein